MQTVRLRAFAPVGRFLQGGSCRSRSRAYSVIGRHPARAAAHAPVVVIAVDKACARPLITQEHREQHFLVEVIAARCLSPRRPWPCVRHARLRSASSALDTRRRPARRIFGDAVGHRVTNASPCPFVQRHERHKSCPSRTFLQRDKQSPAPMVRVSIDTPSQTIADARPTCGRVQPFFCCP